MSKAAVVPPVKTEAQTPEVAASAVEQKAPLAVEAASSVSAKPTATAAAVEKAAAKPKVAKKVVAAKPAKKVEAEKPASAATALAKPAKKDTAIAKKKLAAAPNAEKAAKVVKVKKPKLVRDSFTIPETDYALFATLKQRALKAGIEVKKSEILRAAMATLAKQSDVELAKAIGLVERIKIGRPKK